MCEIRRGRGGVREGEKGCSVVPKKEGGIYKCVCIRFMTGLYIWTHLKKG